MSMRWTLCSKYTVYCDLVQQPNKTTHWSLKYNIMLTLWEGCYPTLICKLSCCFIMLQCTYGKYIIIATVRDYTHYEYRKYWDDWVTGQNSGKTLLYHIAWSKTMQSKKWRMWESLIRQSLCVPGRGHCAKCYITAKDESTGSSTRAGSAMHQHIQMLVFLVRPEDWRIGLFVCCFCLRWPHKNNQPSNYCQNGLSPLSLPLRCEKDKCILQNAFQ